MTGATMIDEANKSGTPGIVRVDRPVRPRAWADDRAMDGDVGNVDSNAAKNYWERSDWVDRASAARLCHPLYGLPDIESVVHSAVLRALDEAGVRNDVLRGMCVEVALEKAHDELGA